MLNVKKTIKHYILKKSFITSSELGWGNNYNSKIETQFNGKYTAKKHTVKSFKLYNYNIKTLHKIINLCKRKKIKVVFITTPTHNSYYQHLNKNQLEITTKSISKLVKDNSNCEYLDFLKSEKFTKKDFYDADHLNEIGAKKLSFLLNSKIF